MLQRSLDMAYQAQKSPPRRHCVTVLKENKQSDLGVIAASPWKTGSLEGAMWTQNKKGAFHPRVKKAIMGIVKQLCLSTIRVDVRKDRGGRVPLVSFRAANC